MTALDGAFLLAPDLLVIPLTDLDAEARERIGTTPMTHALTRRRARRPSTLIDAEAFGLLQQFVEPRTIPEAILRHSRGLGLDPDETLTRCYPLLKFLVAAGLLRPCGRGEPAGPRLQPGDIVEEWTVIRCVQQLEDSEVYQVRAADRGYGALKLALAGTRFQNLDREAAVLRHLAGAVAPALVSRGHFNDASYLITEWILGISAVVAFVEQRRRSSAADRRELLRLAARIARSYALLHARGVVHGDVHPNNVLVDADGAVHVIDFGLARLDSGFAALTAPARGGVPFFIEAEYARAWLEGRTPPQATAVGEVYSLGALLYYLIAGVHYIDFSLERERAFRQIAQDPPATFAGRRIEPWPEVETLLTEALRKDPAERLPSAAELADRLTALEREDSAARVIRRRDASAADVASLVGDTIERFELEGEVDAPRHDSAGIPTESLAYGAAGVAYALYRMSILTDSPHALALADVWSSRAVTRADRPEAFYSETLGVTRERVGDVSLFYSTAGVWLTAALVAAARLDEGAYGAATTRLLVASRQPCDPFDLTSGRPGLLLGCAALLDRGLPDAPAWTTSIREAGQRLALDLLTEVDRLPPIGEGPSLEALGMAHGWSGVLYALLRWTHAIEAPADAGVLERLVQLRRLAEAYGRGLRWPVRLAGSGHQPAQTGWCNGSAGHVHLWTLAYAMTGDAEHLEVAERAAWNVWEGSGENPTLCCGLAGRALSLARLWQCSHQAHWLARARRLAHEACTASPARSSQFSDSLLKGPLGVVLAAAELERPGEAVSPPG